MERDRIVAVERDRIVAVERNRIKFGEFLNLVLICEKVYRKRYAKV